MRGSAAGMLEALRSTGGVITSAGILLASVFAVLGVLPLISMHTGPSTSRRYRFFTCHAWPWLCRRRLPLCLPAITDLAGSIWMPPVLVP